MTANNKSIITDAGGDLTNRNGPWGRLNQKVCSHAVGLIGAVEGNLQRHWGRFQGNRDIKKESG